MTSNPTMFVEAFELPVAVTVAVRVTDSPKTEGFGVAMREVVVVF